MKIKLPLSDEDRNLCRRYAALKVRQTNEEGATQQYVVSSDPSSSSDKRLEQTFQGLCAELAVARFNGVLPEFLKERWKKGQPDFINSMGCWEEVKARSYKWDSIDVNILMFYYAKRSPLEPRVWICYFRPSDIQVIKTITKPDLLKCERPTGTFFVVPLSEDDWQGIEL